MMAKEPAATVSRTRAPAVSLYGRLTPVIRIASTEGMSSVQALDNSHSSSRFGIRSSGGINKSMSVSSTIEVGVNGPNRPGSGFDISGGAPSIALRIAEASISDASMGTVTIGHGWLAGGGFGANFAGTGHVFGIWGPGGDGIKATKDGVEVGNGVRHGGGPFLAYGARVARIMYATPNVMGLGLRASYNQDKGWGAGASFSGFPNMKEVSIAANASYHSVGEEGDETGFGVSGSVKHNSSGVLATGIYGKQGDLTTWMVEGGWTGALNKMGATSVTLGYGQWGDGVSASNRYHLAINQNIASAGTNVYIGVAYDNGNATHTVAHAAGAGSGFSVDSATGDIVAGTGGTFWGGEGGFDPAGGGPVGGPTPGNTHTPLPRGRHFWR